MNTLSDAFLKSANSLVEENNKLKGQKAQLTEKCAKLNEQIKSQQEKIETLSSNRPTYLEIGTPKGEKIPLYARILCIADSYDAMTTDRVYRKKLSKDTVLQELEKNKGKQFDPHLADVFIGMIRAGTV